MFKITFLWTLFSTVMMMPNIAIASEKSSGHSSIPKEYRLEDVKISVLYQTGHRLPGSYRINISAGKASYVTDRKEKADLIIKDKALVDLLNDFYRIHFFELQDTYTVKRQIALLDDRSISTFPSRLVDMGSKRICIALANYEKCVTIMDEQPIAANQLVNKIEGLFR